ncbi:MAG: response regulator [Planctomycetes bacterium]|nr:response regulator [Planctomycetota bacterium]
MAGEASNSKKILLVDDSEINRELLIGLLKSETWLQIVEARDGMEALGLLESEKPDLLITDVVMPRMSGVQLLAELRKRGYTLPVIMMSSRIRNEEFLPIAELIDMDDVLVKGFSRMELLKLVHKHLG